MKLEDMPIDHLPCAFFRSVQPDAPGDFKADYAIDVKHCAPQSAEERGVIIVTLSHEGVKLLVLGLDGMRAQVLAAKIHEAASKQHGLDSDRAAKEWPELSPPPG